MGAYGLDTWAGLCNIFYDKLNDRPLKNKIIVEWQVLILLPFQSFTKVALFI